MIKPTPRAVAVFAAGIPLTLLLVIYSPDLWEFPLAYGLVALVVDTVVSLVMRSLTSSSSL